MQEASETAAEEELPSPYPLPKGEEWAAASQEAPTVPAAQASPAAQESPGRTSALETPVTADAIRRAAAELRAALEPPAAMGELSAPEEQAAPEVPAAQEQQPLEDEPAALEEPDIEEPERRAPRVEVIEGIGPAYAGKLAAVGVLTTDDLLETAGSRKGREDLAEETSISGKLILGWVNRADLMRVPGVGEEYSDLLELAGVDTIRELRQRKPENLHQKMIEANQTRKVVQHVPSLAEVSAWIEAAKEMKARVAY
jgi:predicted flap endonuclease-1-like 5' DNA nuclease